MPQNPVSLDPAKAMDFANSLIVYDGDLGVRVKFIGIKLKDLGQDGLSEDSVRKIIRTAVDQNEIEPVKEYVLGKFNELAEGIKKREDKVLSVKQSDSFRSSLIVDDDNPNKNILNLIYMQLPSNRNVGITTEDVTKALELNQDPSIAAFVWEKFDEQSHTHSAAQIRKSNRQK